MEERMNEFNDSMKARTAGWEEVRMYKGENSTVNTGNDEWEQEKRKTTVA